MAPLFEFAWLSLLGPFPYGLQLPCRSLAPFPYCLELACPSLLASPSIAWHWLFLLICWPPSIARLDENSTIGIGTPLSMGYKMISFSLIVRVGIQSWNLLSDFIPSPHLLSFLTSILAPNKYFWSPLIQIWFIGLSFILGFWGFLFQVRPSSCRDCLGHWFVCSRSLLWTFGWVRRRCCIVRLDCADIGSVRVWLLFALPWIIIYFFGWVCHRCCIARLDLSRTWRWLNNSGNWLWLIKPCFWLSMIR